MIDLRFPELPHRLECGGSLFEVETSFRTWIEFGRMLEEEHMAWFGIFKGERPEGDDWVEAAVEFYRSTNPVPRGNSDGARALDLLADGELIVAAFQQAYGIDLTAGDMHWHRFKALLAGIPDETKLSKVIGYRLYKTPPDKPPKNYNDQQMRKLQRAWALPRIKSREEEDFDSLADEWFG